jgi:hypothetical protein
VCTVQDIPGQISITFDAWTSDASDPYLGVTAHYIHSEADQPNEWELRSKVLGYTEIQGNHSGANIAAVILHVVDQYGIHHKVCGYQLLKGNDTDSYFTIAWLGYIRQCNNQ